MTGFVLLLGVITAASVLCGLLLARTGLRWQYLTGAAVVFAVVASFIPSLPAFAEVARGGDPVALVGILVTIPLVSLLVFLGWGLGVALARPPAPVARNVGTALVLAVVPTVALAFLLHMQIEWIIAEIRYWRLPS